MSYGLSFIHLPDLQSKRKGPAKIENGKTGIRDTRYTDREYEVDKTFIISLQCA